MATWITHLRIAESILNKYNFEIEPFLVGSIGPDSGVPNEDWSQFDPPKKITHWTNESGKIEAEAFFDKYIRYQKFSEDNQKYSFLVGYYFHLIADIEWSKMHKEKSNVHSYKEKFEKDPNFIWTIKKDWYGFDFKYLKDNPNSMFFKNFMHITDIPDYLDYFPKDAFMRQAKYITNYYLNEKPDLDRPFMYLTEEDMDKYVLNTTELLDKMVKEKKILLDKEHSDSE